MDKKLKKIALSHPIREQLAEVILNLEGFEIDKNTSHNIITNKGTWNKNNKKKTLTRSIDYIFKLIHIVQKKIGLINIKVFNTESDISFSNGGFLITNKPYIIYIEKASQIFGYTAKNYNKYLSKTLLINRLKDKKLKKVFFRTKTAMIGFKNTFKNDEIISSLIRNKGVYVYPPAINPENITLNRFENIKKIKFLFISSKFSLKGGDELFNAFKKLLKKYNNIELNVITKESNINKDILEYIKSSKYINIIDANLTRNELFKKYINTSHCFVYPTYADSFSMVVNEAIAGYLPIITSDYFSIPERIIEGKNGFMFKSPFPNYYNDFIIKFERNDLDKNFNETIIKNQKEGELKYIEDFLYEKMEYLINNPKKIKEMAEEAKNVYKTTLLNNSKKITGYFS